MIHKLSELFISIQGEALFVGKRALFLRYAFCNLDCDFCDTPQKSKITLEITTQEIVDIVDREEIRHVVLTGGEPLLQISNITNVIETLSTCTFEIETNGILLRDAVPLMNNSRVYFNISPKVKKFREKYKEVLIPEQSIFKFPVNKSNITETREFITFFNLPKDKIYYMPICKNYTEYVLVADWVLEQALQDKVNFSPRLHLIQNIK